MALILNIDTALDTATISLAENGKVLVSAENEKQKDHAAWLQPAIKDLLAQSGHNIPDLQAIGVSVGPGSYTGLRIGLSSAKGMCYALNIPLIAETSLKILALSAANYLEEQEAGSDYGNLLLCPMIDARRMEVFTAIYSANLQEVQEPQALILNANSFQDILERQKMLFLGNGSLKFQPICQNAHAIFRKIPSKPIALAWLTYRNFIGNNFADLAYMEPLYLKEFFSKERAK